MEKQSAPVLTCLKLSPREEDAVEKTVCEHREESVKPANEPGSGKWAEADLLDRLAAPGAGTERLSRESKRCLGEISALRSENRWEDILALFHPVEEKVPELAAAGFAVQVRSEMAFVLGQVGRFEEAIAQYRLCAEAEPDNFHFHAGLAYSAYNSLYGVKSRQVTLHPAEKKERIELAHRHFAAAQALRPEGITNYYREGMLYKQIQGKRDKAMPLFEKSVCNWLAYSDEKKKERHQERKNYVKALYHLASCKLHEGQPREALKLIQRCIQEDEGSNHMSPVHKYFALGKTCFELGRHDEALQALNVATVKADPADDDFVFELMARICLAQNNLDKAWEAITRVPPHRRRPYVRWTEADILTAQGRADQACRILKEAAERDRRGRHKALIRLARLEFSRHQYAESLRYAQQANSFFHSNYQNPYDVALFWEAAALLRLQRFEEAGRKTEELAAFHPNYPHLTKLKQLLRSTVAEKTEEQNP